MRTLPSTQKQVHPHRYEVGVTGTINAKNTRSSIDPNSNKQRQVENAKIGSPFYGKRCRTTNTQDAEEIDNSPHYQVEITVRRTHLRTEGFNGGGQSSRSRFIGIRTRYSKFVNE
jgi:hypothetical protein